MPMSAFLVHSFAIPDFIKYILAPVVVDAVRYIRSVIFVLALSHVCVIESNFLQKLGLEGLRKKIGRGEVMTHRSPPSNRNLAE